MNIDLASDQNGANLKAAERRFFVRIFSVFRREVSRQAVSFI